jgi:hypothetical protein
VWLLLLLLVMVVVVLQALPHGAWQGSYRVNQLVQASCSMGVLGRSTLLCHTGSSSAAKTLAAQSNTW